MAIIQNIQCVHWKDMPEEVQDDIRGIFEVQEGSIVQIYWDDDGESITHEWLRNIGFKFEKEYTWLGIILQEEYED